MLFQKHLYGADFIGRKKTYDCIYSGKKHNKKNMLFQLYLASAVFKVLKDQSFVRFM
jgi:hypothetical protein